MEQKATINPVKVPRTPIECPTCGKIYKERRVMQRIKDGHPWSTCPEDHTNLMSIRKTNKLTIISVVPSHERSKEQGGNGQRSRKYSTEGKKQSKSSFRSIPQE